MDIDLVEQATGSYAAQLRRELVAAARRRPLPRRQVVPARAQELSREVHGG